MSKNFLKTLKFPGLDKIYDIPTTAEDVGAAPAGYGYGEVTRLVWWDDADGTKLEAYLDGIFTNINMLDKVYRYSLVDYPACAVSSQGGYADIVCTDMPDGVPQTIIVTFYAVESGGIGGMAIATKKKHGGVWHPWEYINPPMVLGEEYRTTERWNGKVVYTKLVNYSGMPNSNRYAVAHGAAATQILRCAGMNITTGMNIPCDTVSVFADKTHITIITTANQNGGKAYVQIWYTKD